MIASLAMVVAMATTAAAQREGGRGGFGGFGGFGRGAGYISQVQLAARSDAVQDALQLTDEQKRKIDDINNQLREGMRDLFQQGFGPEFRQQMQKLNEESAAKLADVLDAQQKDRLLGIAIQVNGPATLVAEPAVAEKLAITQEQKSALADQAAENMRSMRDARQELEGQDLPRREFRAKMDEMRAERDKKLLALLTSEQQAQFEALKGEAVEIDRSQLFPGGRGGPGGPGGPDGRGGRRFGRERGDRGGRGAGPGAPSSAELDDANQ